MYALRVMCSAEGKMVPTLHETGKLQNTLYSWCDLILQCRSAGTTYSGRMSVDLCCVVNGRRLESLEKYVGEIPIMVKASIIRPC